MKKLIFLTLMVLPSTPLALFAKKSADAPSAAILTAWMDLHCKLVRRTTGIAHVAFSRQFCYTAIAAYESVVKSNASYRSLAGQLTGLSSLPATKAKLFWPASLNAGYAGVLRSFYGLFPSCISTIDSMEKAQEKSFWQSGVAQQAVNHSIEYGNKIALAVLNWAEDDGTLNTKQYTPLQGEEVWTPATKAAEPFWFERRSLTKNLFSVYTLTPPVYGSDSASAFYKLAYDVYNTSINLTPQQKATALYWDDSPGEKYISVFGHWTAILASLIRQQHLSLVEGAAAFAKMAITLHEAALLTWKGKYQYNVLRPVTFIQRHIDKQWTPLIETPPHPEFPAAHATFSNAAATALCSLFGQACRVTDDTYTDIGMPQRTYASLNDVAKEAGYSRLYGGIHYRYSIEQGFLLGEAAARYVEKAIQFKRKK